MISWVLTRMEMGSLRFDNRKWCSSPWRLANCHFKQFPVQNCGSKSVLLGSIAVCPPQPQAQSYISIGGSSSNQQWDSTEHNPQQCAVRRRVWVSRNPMTGGGTERNVIYFITLFRTRFYYICFCFIVFCVWKFFQCSGQWRTIEINLHLSQPSHLISLTPTRPSNCLAGHYTECKQKSETIPQGNRGNIGAYTEGNNAAECVGWGGRGFGKAEWEGRRRRLKDKQQAQRLFPLIDFQCTHWQSKMMCTEKIE